MPEGSVGGETPDPHQTDHDLSRSHRAPFPPVRGAKPHPPKSPCLGDLSHLLHRSERTLGISAVRVQVVPVHHLPASSRTRNGTRAGRGPLSRRNRGADDGAIGDGAPAKQGTLLSSRPGPAAGYLWPCPSGAGHDLSCRNANRL